MSGVRADFPDLQKSAFHTLEPEYCASHICGVFENDLLRVFPRI